MKQFCRWLQRDRRANENRLAHLQGGNVKLDIRRERRELSESEIAHLLKHAQTGPVRIGLSGEQRFMLYATALGTGLRASELASLTPSHFCLTTVPATVRIDAADEKARRGDTLPLPQDLVRLLSPWLAGKPKDSALWPGRWATNKAAGKFLKADLEAARKAWVTEESPDAGERATSDFLTYRNSDGQMADFHALRHTYLSRLGRSGASPKVMQRLARHSTVELTLGRYTHAGLHDLSSAVDGLPALPVPREPAHELRATGTQCCDTSPVLPSGLPERVAVRFPSVHSHATEGNASRAAARQRENRVKPAKRLDSAAFTHYDSDSQHTPGEVAEWSIAPVLKTGNP